MTSTANNTRTPGVQRFNSDFWLPIAGLAMAVVALMFIGLQLTAGVAIVVDDLKTNIANSSEACAVNTGEARPMGISFGGDTAFCAWGGTATLN